MGHKKAGLQWEGVLRLIINLKRLNLPLQPVLPQSGTKKIQGSTADNILR